MCNKGLCVIKNVLNKMSRRLTNEDFINKSKSIHGKKYDYSLVEYINNETKVCIICPLHGVFFQKPKHFISGCKECMKDKFKTSKDAFLKKCNLAHGEKYDYSLVKYINDKSKITIVCKKHGKFSQLAGNHIRGSGCPRCYISKGELLVKEYLIKNKIKFIEQKTFSTCKRIRLLRFDFYLPKYNILIEYQGYQHFCPIKRCKTWTTQRSLKEFERIKKNDKIKKQWCLSNGKKLIEIKYNSKNMFKNIKKEIGL